MLRNNKAVAMCSLKNQMGKIALLLCTVMVLGACASTQNDAVMASDVEISDPFEDTNRAVFAFNDAVNDAVFHPVLKGYRAVTPEFARDGVDNFLTNLKNPVVLVNEVLQGDMDGAGNVLLRTVVNTLIGVGGLFDVAGYEGYKHVPEDFGQTLAVWGFDHGPYLVLPILGPSSTRDYVGYLVDAFADPLRWYLFNVDKENVYYIKTGVDYLNLRNDLMDLLEDLEKNSIDYYAATRSIYYQRRQALVNDDNSETGDAFAIPDYDE